MSSDPHPFTRNRFLQIITAAYAALWLVLAIRPVDRADWFLENLLVFATVGLLAITHRWFVFSNVSYALLAVFLALHAIGAHYTYAQVPIGFWVSELFQIGRNHFDRAIHFGFGLLLVYPVCEFLARRVTPRPAWAIWLAVATIIGMSSFFEVLEAIIAQIVHPELGAAYLGTQGDMWDGQKDMALAAVGALITALVMTLSRRELTPR